MCKWMLPEGSWPKWGVRGLVLQTHSQNRSLRAKLLKFVRFTDPFKGEDERVHENMEFHYIPWIESLKDEAESS